MTLGLGDLAFVGAAAGASFDFLNPANIGQPVGGGYFAGLISHTANGSPTHVLIVAPAESGATGTGYSLTTDLSWSPLSSKTASTSEFDGAANTAVLVDNGINNYPAAKFCTELTIGGFTDWYLPSRYEMGIAYINLKPSTVSNYSFSGVNPYSVPKRNSTYTATIPGQTSIASFQSGNAQAFSVTSTHWSSTQSNEFQARVFIMDGRDDAGNNKNNLRLVRAFRRIAL